MRHKFNNDDRAKALGKRQQDIVLWIAQQQGIPFTEKITNPILLGIAAITKNWNELGASESDGRIAWSSKDFLGYEPTNKETSAVSRSLASLDDRGYVKRFGQNRTDSVKLTPAGIDAARRIAKDRGLTDARRIQTDARNS